MDGIKNYNPAEAETLDSREVAEMVEKNHKDLLRDIRGYIEIMQEADEISQRKIAPSDFFIESTIAENSTPVSWSPRRAVSSSPTSSPARRGRSLPPCT